MVKIGDTTLPGTIIELERRKRRIYLEKMIPGNSLAKRLDRGGYGIDFILRGVLTSDIINNQATIEDLADGTKRVLDLEDGSTSMECLALDPVFRRDEQKPNRIFYELPLVQTSYFDSRSLSEAFAGFSESLSATLGAQRIVQQIFGDFSELLSYVANSYKLQETFGGFSEALSYLPGAERLLSHTFGGFSESLVGQLSNHWGVTSPGSTGYPEYTQTQGAGGSSTSGFQGSLRGNKFTVAASGTIKKVGFQVVTADGNARVALYGDSTGDPAALLSESASVPVSATGWKDVALSPAVFALSGVDRWFVGQFDSDSLALKYDSYSTKIRSFTYGPFPDPFGTPTTNNYPVQYRSTYVQIQNFIKGFLTTVGRTGPIYGVRFYAHADATEKARLALYDNASPKARLWQIGPVDVVTGWNFFPISSGSPASLNLTLNDVVSLAWQFNDVVDVPSYVAGSSGDGWFKEHTFGAFPATISGETSSAEKWAMYGMTW